MQSLGTTATVPNVGDARELAREAMRAAAAGIDPRAEQRAVEEAARKEEAVAAFTFGDSSSASSPSTACGIPSRRPSTRRGAS
jgi:hypothetical protein